MKKLFLRVLFLCVVSMPVSLIQAREIADVVINESIVLPDTQQTLVLNGAGIRYKFIFKIYIGALYVSKPSQQASQILDSPEADHMANRMAMHFLYDEVSKEKLVDGWLDGFKSNLTEEKYTALKPQIDQFNSLFKTVTAGDVVLLDYHPAQGTRVSIAGEFKGLVKGKAFNRALLSIWLGEDPVTEELKQALLGVED